MQWFFNLYGIQIIILMILIIGSWFIWDRRFKMQVDKTIPKGFVRTNEMFFDPTTRKKLIVYYHPHTGERIYIEE